MIDPMMAAAEHEAKEKINRKESFAKWMDQPATRMMVSMIPPGERQEVLETLLLETFNAGYGAGAGNTAGDFLKAMLSSMAADRRSER